jgi:hypothetical protein
MIGKITGYAIIQAGGRAEKEGVFWKKMID